MSRPLAIVFTIVLSALVSGCAGSKGQATETSDSTVPSPGATGTDAPTASDAPVELSDEELEEYGVDPDPDIAKPCVPPASVVKDGAKPLDLNKSFEGGAHVHDYWEGRKEFELWSFEVETGGVVPTPTATGVQWLHPDGVHVFPGATKAIFTVTWQDAVPGVPETRELLWDMPGDEYNSGDLLSHVFLKSGDTYELALNLSNADPPHFNRTLWTFQLMNPETGYWVPGHITWVIQTDLECLPVDPPHYDLWKGASQQILLDGEKAGTWRRAGAQSGGLQAPPLFPNATTYGASMVRVTLTWTDAPTNSKLGLRYCTADSPCGLIGAKWSTPTTFTEAGPTKRVYELPVEQIDMDSPYVSRSGWGFQPYMDNGALAPVLADNGNFEGTAHWLIEILK